MPNTVWVGLWSWCHIANETSWQIQLDFRSWRASARVAIPLTRPVQIQLHGMCSARAQKMGEMVPNYRANIWRVCFDNTVFDWLMNSGYFDRRRVELTGGSLINVTKTNCYANSHWMDQCTVLFTGIPEKKCLRTGLSIWCGMISAEQTIRRIHIFSFALSLFNMKQSSWTSDLIKYSTIFDTHPEYLQSEYSNSLFTKGSAIVLSP